MMNYLLSTISFAGLFILLTLLTVMAFVGNVFVVFAVYKRPRLRAQFCFHFLAGLAIADICVTIFVMPWSMLYVGFGYWPLGKVLCKIWISCDVLCCTASILHLCLVALDRYMAIAYPLRYAVMVNTKRIRISMLLIWLISAMISFIPIQMGWNELILYQPSPIVNYKTSADSHGNITSDSLPTRSNEQSECELKANIPYAIVSSCTSFYIPFCVFCILYGRIWCIAHTQALQVRQIRVRSFRESQHFIDSDVSLLTRTTQSALVLSNHEAKDWPESSKRRSFLNTRQSDPISTKCECSGHEQLSRNTPGRLHFSPHESHGSRILFPFRSSLHRFSISSMRTEMKAIKTIGLLLGCFMICWLPFFLAYLIRAICQQYCRYPVWLMSILTWIGYANSAANPVLYAFLQKDFRTAVWSMLTGQHQRRITSVRMSNPLPYREDALWEQHGKSSQHKRISSAIELHSKITSKTLPAVTSSSFSVKLPRIPPERNACMSVVERELPKT